jgi:hypothetical protein
MKRKQCLLLATAIAVLVTACHSDISVDTEVDWERFLERHDLVWDSMATKWEEAPFIGNGMIGTMVWQNGDHSLKWDIGRGDVQDHRPGGGMYNRCRLPVGYFMLRTVGKITAGRMKLDLWNAEASGMVETDKGIIRWRSIVHAEHDVLLTIVEPSEGERDFLWEWKSHKAISPRHASSREQEGYAYNPPATLAREGKVNVCVQPLLYGGETATAWEVDRQDEKSIITVSVAHSFPLLKARKEAVDIVENTGSLPPDQMLESHRTWWHAYYPGSFFSIPDTEWESFYWIQMYKLASATRAGGMLIDNQGPWLQPTPWPGVWWNLNVQLTYWPTYASNRTELGSSLGKALYSNMENLIRTVPEPYRYNSAAVAGATGQDCAGEVEAPDGENAPQMGPLLWACHNCWLHYRHTMDDQVLREDLFPLLKRTVNYYFHFITEDRDGKLHLPKTFSPEYKHKMGPDSNFDLALLRWGCTALIEICQRLDMDDPLLPMWRNVLGNLTDYPTDRNGYMIAADVPFAQRHRHFSHLLMIYPLYLVNADQPGAEEMALKSVDHWQSFGIRHGYALTGASSMYSAFGKGNEALKYLRGLREYLHPNTFYSEGPGWPVIETPLSGAQCMHDMIIQSWGGTIRVFPAAPDDWDHLVFHDIRTEGAFLISAVRENGKTKFVRIKSLAGEPCRIIPGLDGEVNVSGYRNFDLLEVSPGVFTLDLKRGEEAILWIGTEMPDLTLAPVPEDEDNCNSFGIN